MSNGFDVIVVGLGAMGGAAAYHCARRGARVVGLDANPPRHALGSSHGRTRAIREAYYEAPEYVPLVWRAFELWRALEAETGTSLLTIGGGIYAGPEGHPLLTGVEAAAGRHELAVELLTRRDLAERYPGLTIPEDWRAIREPNAGQLRAQACLDAHVDLARRHGADLRFGVAAGRWRSTKSGGVRVETNEGAVEAAAAILALGPWAGNGREGFLADLGLPLTVQRVPVVHFCPTDPARYDPKHLSIFMAGTPEGVFAALPEGVAGVKIIRHDPGGACTPATVAREVTAADVAPLAAFADAYLPPANGGIGLTEVCLYTMTPDAHFIVDRHPGFGTVAYAAGFSGHGFKFAPVIGEILADLVFDGRTRHPIGFFSPDRFSHSRAGAGSLL